jgi:hypothetical protein
MNVGIVDVDGHNFPNLSLMKISAYHKQKGDNVEMCIPLKRYNKVYVSKVFTFTPDIDFIPQAKEVIYGGTGYDLKNKLPIEIENIYPDYELYGVKEAYGFLTRGCPRACDFCIVAEKEGRCSVKVADLKEFWNGQKEIKLLDPNLLACKDRIELLDQLIQSKAYIDFTQGLDVRLLDDEIINKIKAIKIKMIHFAWDKRDQDELIIKQLKRFKELTNFDMRKTRVYVLTNFDTTIEQDLERIYKLKELDYDPYVMIYEKEKLPKKHILRRLQRWVNNKFIFRVVETFEEYLKGV